MVFNMPHNISDIESDILSFNITKYERTNIVTLILQYYRLTR